MEQECRSFRIRRHIAALPIFSWHCSLGNVPCCSLPLLSPHLFCLYNRVRSGSHSALSLSLTLLTLSGSLVLTMLWVSKWTFTWQAVEVLRVSHFEVWKSVPLSVSPNRYAARVQTIIWTLKNTPACSCCAWAAHKPCKQFFVLSSRKLFFSSGSIQYSTDKSLLFESWW